MDIKNGNFVIGNTGGDVIAESKTIINGVLNGGNAIPWELLLNEVNTLLLEYTNGDIENAELYAIKEVKKSIIDEDEIKFKKSVSSFSDKLKSFIQQLSLGLLISYITK